jgi:LPXTG-site transpeptidase (sortase) family protein
LGGDFDNSNLWFGIMADCLGASQRCVMTDDWYQKQKDRQIQKKTGETKRVWWQGVLLLAYLMVGASCWSILAIYGPVFWTEVNFQMHRFNLLQPISFELIPPAMAAGYTMAIPSLYIMEPVIAEVDPSKPAVYREALNRGIALASGTKYPGEGGLGYYFAHSSGMNVLAPQKQAIFYLLGKLNVGDEVDIYRERVKYKYRVTKTEITNPTDLSFLSRNIETEQIVLQTCWPIGTSLQRLLVTAELF